MRFFQTGSRWREVVVALLLWISATLVSLYLVATEQQGNHRARFLQNAYLLQNTIQTNLKINEFVLENIADQVGPADLFQQNRIRALIEEVIEPYPHIRSVLLFPTVSIEERGDFIRRFNNLYPSDPITAVDHHTTPYSPIALEQSRDKGMPQLLGSDAREMVALRGTIDMVTDHLQLSSLPTPVGGQQHYFLVANGKRELRHRDDSFPWYSKIQVALLIDPNRMVPADPSVDITLSLQTPSNREEINLIETRNETNDHLFTHPLHYSSRLDSMSQPFTLEASQAVPLASISLTTSVLLGIFSLLYFFLALRLIMTRVATRRQEQISEKKMTINSNNRIQMMNAISHDIRTPLTRLRLRARVLGSGEQGKILSDLDEIDQLVERSINFLQDETLVEEPAICDLNHLLLTIRREMEESDHYFTINGRAEWPYLCQILELKRAIQNLLNNGFHYSGEVELHISDTRQHLAIEVIDDGPGIEEALIDKVTRPYVRGDKSRGKNSGGIGLGLSIVQQICETHGGQLLLRNRPQGGLSATLHLPR